MNKYNSPTPFTFESKKQLPSMKIAYHTFGKINKNKDNVIWVFHAISAHSNVLDWWPGLFGEEDLYNPKDYFIICANTIGSPYGSTKPTNTDFPNFTVRDVVKAHQLLAKSLGVSKIHTAIGGSFGGYQALEFAYSFEGSIEHLILLASSAKESAWGIAIHESQRIAMQTDTTFGKEDGGQAGLKAARSIAMLTYRTSQVFVDNQTDDDQKLDNFKASSYIQYQGDKFVKSFSPLSYFYLTKCIDSHNIGRGRGGEVQALQEIKIPTLVIGFTSDTLVPLRFQKFLAEHIPNAVFQEFQSQYGHDGFLKETEKISNSIKQFYENNNTLTNDSKRTILKFGGTSLYGQKNLENILSIIEKQQKKGPLALVVSARGKSTDWLIRLYDLAKVGDDFSFLFASFQKYLEEDFLSFNNSAELEKLKSILLAIQLLKEDNEFAYDSVLAFGEIISAKSISNLLNQHRLKAKYIDARKIIFTEKVLDEFEVNMDKSRALSRAELLNIPEDTIPVITGFIASSEKGRTVTLGRNGSNYTATLIANFIQANEVQNWTDVKGVFSSNPSIVPNAIQIHAMTYREANEMANFGVNLLHPKTILPLMQSKIPLIIKSTQQPEEPGTIINNEGGRKGIKAVTMIEDVALVTIEGNDLSENVGIEARIFSALLKKGISGKMISQASSERGIGFVISNNDITNTELILNKEFQQELRLQQISSIRINSDIGIIAIIGRHNYALEKAIHALRRNGIWMHLISNSINGEHISLVINKAAMRKAVRLVHNEVFGVLKTIYVFAFGKGLVGTELVNQVLETAPNLIKERRLAVKIIGVADSKRYLIQAEGISSDWKEQLATAPRVHTVSKLIEELKDLGLENLIIVDNTSSQLISDHYLDFVKANFDIVASNKKANSSALEDYRTLRKTLLQRGGHFYYETNVGAGLPVIDFLRSLYQSADVVTKIKGVFSGSLSYIFNNFSAQPLPFSEQLKKAMAEGFTEPDPREDLNGLDVARKLVILAREINYPAKIESVVVQNLIPEALRNLESTAEFLSKEEKMNEFYNIQKQQLNSNEVLRYVAELDIAKQRLTVQLQRIPSDTPLGQIKNADSLFEIYTESYGEQPIVIQGAGAGPKVTARAVYSDLLRLGNRL
ncbi:MAG: bifunctional aspartate kinase/homoserine dehydrogenase I [Saprospiraceae bacterium]